ncbi:MAG: hypothetical protein HOJ16_07635 [Candidatus Peribacter sp.]|nr:hypothetical protein [Candidatus Peribacter sp.]
MKTFLLLLTLACASVDQEEKEERKIVAIVCYNPNSVWHLSECNDECTKRDYDGDAHCFGLANTMCEAQEKPEHIRMACGLYY